MPKKNWTPSRRKRWGAAQAKRLRKRMAAALYHAEVRTYVARRLSQRATTRVIAKELEIPRKDVEAYMDRSLERLNEIGPHFRGDPYDPEDIPQRRRGSKPGSGPGPHVEGSPKGTTPVFADGEILDPPDEIEFKKQAFELRKRALSFDEISEMLGRPVEECRRAVKQKLRFLERDELQDIALAKRMMLEQLDSMIAAITVPSTGRDIDGNTHPVILEAIDRMIKLLDQKAKLLGLNAPQRVDLNHRIEVLADETGYDVEELRTIAQEVLQSYQSRSLR